MTSSANKQKFSLRTFELAVMLTLFAHLSIIFIGVREASLSESPGKAFYYTRQKTLKQS
jgi:hypothetical protein